MTAQIFFALPQRPADDVLRDKINRIVRALADPDVEPLTHARLSLEADRLRRLLRACSQSEGNQ